MQTLSKTQKITREHEIYFQNFISKNGDEFGLRFGTPKDAKAISEIFKENYDYEYAYPLIYDLNHLKKELSKDTNYWFIGELVDKNEIVGTGLLEKKRYIIHTSQAVVKKKYQGQGITSKIGAAGIIKVLKMPQFKDVLRLDTEVRGTMIGAQKLNQNAGATPYGLIPAYINYGDKRHFKVDDNNPVPPLKEEAAFLYSIMFRHLWKRRDKKVYLLDNEDIIFFYNYIKKKAKKMNEDILILEKGKKDRAYELYGVSRDFYEGRVNIYGYAKEKSLNQLLKRFQNWRIILWRIPTTQNGVHSMSLALKKGFNIVGYDVGFNNINSTLFDSVIFVYYPKGDSTVLNINCLDESKPLLNKIREIFISRIN